MCTLEKSTKTREAKTEIEKFNLEKNSAAEQCLELVLVDALKEAS
jgi:hypothetical protein